MLTIRDSTKADVLTLAKDLRDADLQECNAHGISGYDGLNLSYLRSSYSKTVLLGGDILAMFGAVTDQDAPDSAIVWLLGSKLIEKHSFLFLKQSKKEFMSLMSNYKKASNLILKTNVLHIKWCKFLGFKITPYDNTFDIITYTKGDK